MEHNEEVILLKVCKNINRQYKVNNRIDQLLEAPLSVSEVEYLTLYLLMYRSLSTLLSDDKQLNLWLRGYNSSLDGYPINIMLSTQGLKQINQYLEAQVIY
jgi:hypothetical protein